MTKYTRIINGECHFTMIETFDDIEKATDTRNRGELVECNVDNLRIDFTKVKKEQDARHQNAPAKAEGSSS